ncbi:PGAP1-domain-containing protein [Fomitiporia mediterranea MF3/22]|uniref:PGAP1-domain-containing protein n=1 Tax=Fomitiporia mediterranea (strain MF3/22) TaxID=694068 RepID=UPI00044079A4|nr:PGAP1-domain-containing protein [Fomitiporia mediterranea MF3/22]EJD01013.1 PGAP1-domain-containing protein [Fomitiporia mediterranea MF3/22]
MLRSTVLAGLSLLITLLLAYSAFDTPTKISPQGCRMSYMSPSYVLQTGFNASWTSASLASRYRLMLYREVGWDSTDELRGIPVLFIPGNAGSAHQVRSIASSATRQFYSSPSHISPAFASRNLRPLDVFAVDFNEDLSAFHGPTLASQRQYSADAISYILSLYPKGTQILVMGHSMGGLVATTLLPASHISAVITMSTPHSVPPARFDSRMDAIYADVQDRLMHDSTPILSICGGITDTMIPSEFCTLPPSKGEDAGFRKTVFTSSLEGCWSGVGHREMVWCHQVRWRVARALLEIGGENTKDGIARVLRDWFRDGISSPRHELGENEHDAMDSPNLTAAAAQLVSPAFIYPPLGTSSYKLLIPKSRDPRKVVFYLSEGTILSVSPANPLPLSAKLHICRQTVAESSDPPIPICNTVHPTSLRLIPNPDSTKPFPIPKEGVDESEGVVVLTADLPPNYGETFEEWLQIDVHSETSRAWVTASIEDAQPVMGYFSAFVPLFGDIEIRLDPMVLYTDIRLVNVLSNALLVYRSRVKLNKSCEGSVLPPLLLHTSGPVEAHYHRLSNDGTNFLHGHSSAPFLPIPKDLSETYSRGLNLTIYSSGVCGVETLYITIDWWNTFGRWGARYWNAVLTWSAGVICFLFYWSWSMWDANSSMPAPSQALEYAARLLPQTMLLFTLISFVPLPSAYWLGNVGEPMFAPLAALILFVSCGLVVLSWIGLTSILLPYGKLVSFITRAPDDNSKEKPASLSGALFTILFMSLLVFLFIPWQVAFLACYLIHWHHCALLLQVSTSNQTQISTRNQKLLFLLGMTWCLPVVAPVLIVWVRTLATAGLTTPFDGDHVALNSLSFVALSYAMATTRGPIFQRRHRLEFISVPYLYALGAIAAFVLGPRSTYRMYEAINWPTFALVCFRVVSRYVRGAERTASAHAAEARAF